MNFGQSLDEAALFAAHLEWEADPQQFMRLRARYKGRWVYMRENASFPDDPAYSIEIGPDETRELDELPESWSVGPLEWPDDAEPPPEPPFRV